MAPVAGVPVMEVIAQDEGVGGVSKAAVTEAEGALFTCILPEAHAFWSLDIRAKTQFYATALALRLYNSMPMACPTPKIIKIMEFGSGLAFAISAIAARAIWTNRTQALKEGAAQLKSHDHGDIKQDLPGKNRSSMTTASDAHVYALLAAVLLKSDVVVGSRFYRSKNKSSIHYRHANIGGGIGQSLAPF
ncbi:hypothetical protein Ancab_030948 [Ancistrocladus abbreviatus]